MQKRFLGSSGLQVSVLSLGAMSFGDSRLPGVGGVDLAGARSLVDMALDAGVTLFDTADAYGRGNSETILGGALGSRRKDVIIASKVFGRMGDADHDAGLSRRHLIDACEASLRRLGTEWIDLYQIHSWDSLTPVEETLRALDDLVRSGKVRYIGCSNLAGWQLMKCLGKSELLGLHRYISQQILYSLLERQSEYELIEAGIDQGVGTLVWSPLGGGYLTGRYRQGGEQGGRLGIANRLDVVDTPRNRALVDELIRIAEQHQATPGQVALAWLLRKPGVTSVILGARNEAQLSDNLGGADLRLANEEMKTLDELSAISVPYPITHHRSGGAERNPLRAGWVD